jgi:hypothetical protein
MADRREKMEEQLRLTAEREKVVAAEGRVVATTRLVSSAMDRLVALMVSTEIDGALDDPDLQRWFTECDKKSKYALKFNDRKDLYKFFLPLGPLRQYDFTVPGYGSPIVDGDPFPPPAGAVQTSTSGPIDAVAEVVHRFILICDAARANRTEPDVVLSPDQLAELRRAGYSTVSYGAPSPSP